jgi:menaquinone-9 beta-reductase
VSDTAKHAAAAHAAGAGADRADVVIVGAGPAGSTAAYHLASAGLDVLVCEKSAFPREKVCGDGLTPRAVRQLLAMGIDVNGPGWTRNHGLRIIGGGMRLELPWPELSEYPSFGLVRTRRDFDALLAETAVAAGARLRQNTTVREPIMGDGGRLVGVRVRGPEGEQELRAPLVLAADGNSSRLGLAMGMRKREDRPMGVAVRTYFAGTRHEDDYLESWLELWDSRPEGRTLLPGYGWVFPVGDGTSNVGLGILNSSRSFQRLDYRELLRRWTAGMPEEWEFTPDTQCGEIRGSALPMGFNRFPHYARGLMLLGDAAGMINPFNGEGIAYAMEGARIAADVAVQALARPAGADRERALRAYPRLLRAHYGGYYTLGRQFVRLIGRPGFMHYATRYGLRRATLMRFTLKLLANLTEPREGDAMDRVINIMSRLAPAA